MTTGMTSIVEASTFNQFEVGSRLDNANKDLQKATSLFASTIANDANALTESEKVRNGYTL